MNNRQIRIVTLLTGIAVTALGVVHLIYPSFGGYLSQVSSTITSGYLGYMGS